MPADHYITPATAFRRTLGERDRRLRAARGAIVVIGVTPTRAESGYGYQQIGRPVGARLQGRAVRREAGARGGAPDGRSGKFLWNAGMFVMGARRWPPNWRSMPGARRRDARVRRSAGGQARAHLPQARFRCLRSRGGREEPQRAERARALSMARRGELGGAVGGAARSRRQRAHRQSDRARQEGVLARGGEGA